MKDLVSRRLRVKNLEFYLPKIAKVTKMRFIFVVERKKCSHKFNK